MSSEPLLDKNTILEAFRRLATRLEHRHIVVDVYLFGGGAMVFALSDREATQDLDARFTSTSAAVAEVRAVAEELGLPSWWLNEQVTPYLPMRDEPFPVPVFDHPNLRVMRASDRHLLAMKVAASRRNTRDLDDIRSLAGRLGLSSPHEVIAAYEEVFPNNPLSASKASAVSEALSTARYSAGEGSATGLCSKCGRTLRSAASVAAGIGPICASRRLAH